jgi:hypothetical protein
MRGRGCLLTIKAKLVTDQPRIGQHRRKTSGFDPRPVSFAPHDEIGNRRDQLYNAICSIGSNQG